MKAQILAMGFLAAGLALGGCALGGGSHDGPLPSVASAPPGGYPIEQEPPGGSIRSMPGEEAPVARPVRENLPPVSPAVIGGIASASTAGPVRPVAANASPTKPPEKGPAKAPPPEDVEPVNNAILAEVNGEVITRQDIIRSVRTETQGLRDQLSPEEFEDAVRYYTDLCLRQEISRRLLLQEAKANLSDSEKEQIEAQIKQSEKNLASEAGSAHRLETEMAKTGATPETFKTEERDWRMIQRLLKQKVVPQVHVTHSELLDYYNQVKAERYAQPDRIHMAMIMIKKSESPEPAHARALAQSLYDRILRKEDFSKLATTRSHDPMASKGGDWGFVGRGAFRIKAVDDALWALKAGEVSPIVETDEAFFIVKALERQDARTVPFTEVQAALEQEVRKKKYGDALSQYIQSIYEKSYVHVLRENL
jgi:peptidyl-prolyl cis-trans isomerase C